MLQIYLINTAIGLKQIPCALEVVEVIVLQNYGKPTNETKSYKLMSLLPTISKIFEKLL